MTRALRRSRTLDLPELRHRAAARAWTALEAMRVAAGLERWRRADLADLWIGPSSALPSRPASANASTLDRALRTHFVGRPSRFVIEPGDRASVAAIVHRHFPAASADAAAKGNAIVNGRYHLLGYGDLAFAHGAEPPHWHFDPVHQKTAPRRFWSRVPYLDPQNGDHKIIWELNRHQHWLALGRAVWLTDEVRFGDAVVRELHGWLAANPPLVGVNWASMLELAFRSISWTWALHFFAACPELDGTGWLPDLLVGLHRQLDHVARHLSVYFSPNTHLLGEALALYVGGRVFPELRGAAGWEQRGRDVLVSETTRQVLPDGGHAERSAHYHRYALDFYLLALSIARRTGDPAAAIFEEVASRMASYCRAIADPDGRLPLIGDDDGGMLLPICGRAPADVRDSLWIAATLLDRAELQAGDAPEEAVWMLGTAPELPSAPPEPVLSRHFPDSGYVVIRSADSHAVFDAGPHGYLNGGHAHADSLSLVLWAAGHPLLIDPGTATYTMSNELRDRFRSSAMHNTVVVDSRPQSIPDGPFHWRSRTDAAVQYWHPAAPPGSSDAPLAFVEAQHDAYAPLAHRRAVLRSDDDLWLIVDHLLGAGHHRIDTYFHLDPEWTTAGTELLSLLHTSGRRAAMACASGTPRIVRGDPGGLGWCAPVYGQMVASTTVCFTDVRECPWSVVTAVAPRATRVSIRLVPVRVEADDGWHRVAVIGHLDDRPFAALFSTPLQAKAAPVRSLQRIDGPGGMLATDARVALLRAGVLDVLEARRVSWTGAGAASVGPFAAAANLHLPLVVDSSSATVAARSG